MSESLVLLQPQEQYEAEFYRPVDDVNYMYQGKLLPNRYSMSSFANQHVGPLESRQEQSYLFNSKIVFLL